MQIFLMELSCIYLSMSYSVLWMVVNSFLWVKKEIIFFIKNPQNKIKIINFHDFSVSSIVIDDSSSDFELPYLWIGVSYWHIDSPFMCIDSMTIFVVLLVLKWYIKIFLNKRIWIVFLDIEQIISLWIQISQDLVR